MNSLTNQIAFDIVLAHLIKQGKRAMGDRPLKMQNPLSDGFGCMYKAPDGCSCAVGCLIPDELYRPEFEGEAIRSIIEIDDDMRTHFDDVDVNLLRDLQRVHDCPKCWDDQGFNRYGLEDMFKVSKGYNLVFTMPEGVRV